MIGKKFYNRFQGQESIQSTWLDLLKPLEAALATRKNKESQNTIFVGDSKIPKFDDDDLPKIKSDMDALVFSLFPYWHLTVDTQ